jgi:threonine/homoserine/homoserine lactone efflux protein
MIEIILFAVTSFLIGLSGALVPGPMLTVTISDSFKKGFIAGPLVTSGHIFTEIVVVMLLLFGLGWLIGSPTASFIIGLVGGIVLVIMGFQIFKDTPKLKNSSAHEKNHHENYYRANEPDSAEINSDDENFGKFRSVLNGSITSLSNPFFFIWWATIGGALIFKGMALAGVLGILAFLLGHWSSDLAWFSAVSFFSSQSSTLIEAKNYKIIMNLCGGFMVCVGGYFIINSLGII